MVYRALEVTWLGWENYFRNCGIVRVFPLEERFIRQYKVINLNQEKPRPHFCALGYSGGDMKPRRKAVPQFGSLFCFLSLRKSIIPLVDLGLTPRLLILAMRVWWSTKSNAFRKSRRASRTDAPVPSVAFSHRCNIDISACVIDEPRMKPYRAGSIDCKTTGTRNMSTTKPSATLDRDDVKDISLSTSNFIFHWFHQQSLRT